MVAVSNNFKMAMKQPIKEIQAFIDYDESSIRDSDDLISFKISCNSGLCKTAMRKLEAKFLGSHNLLGKLVKVGYGARLPDGEFEYLNYGSFLVTELTVAKDTDTTSIVGYDLMVNAMTPYVKLDIEYPIRLIDYTRLLCDSCGLELGNSIFGRNVLNISTPKTHNVNGISFVANGDGSITVNGTATKNADFYIAGKWDSTTPVLSLDNSLYKYTSVSNAESDINCFLIHGTEVIHLNYKTNNTTPVRTSKPLTAIMFRVNAGITVDNVTIYPILEKDFNTYTLNYTPYNTMNDWQITATKDTDGNVIDLWENIDGITYRDILVQIAQATGSTCIIGADDKVYFKELTDTGESLTYDNMFKLKLEALYGEINSVVLSRTPAEDNIYLKDEASVQTNGLTEFKIENNEIIDKDRENAITPIFEVLKGISYYPFEATTEGLGWYEIADNITIVNDLGEEFKTSIFNYSITIDGSVKETLKTTAESKPHTQYQYATTLEKRVKNTEVIVNKQEGYIKQLVSDVDGVNEKYSSIYQDIENIVASVQNSGGNNLIKNSVMFAYNSNNVPTDWELAEDGALTISSDTEALANGGLSGHSFTLKGETVRQRVPVKAYNGENATYYTFSTKIKKDVTGSCYVKLYNTNEEHYISIPSGESAFYKDYEIKGLLPKDNYYIVEFYGSADSNATFTDNMLAVGEYKSQWTQANGEVMNTQVNINLDGITVKSSVYLGDYTVISPLEFAGYSIMNGIPTRVFSLNKDVTEVKKLLAKDEIKMPPIKIVPITEGDLQGWAFVPST